TYYDMFQKAIRNILEITEDEEVPRHLTTTSQAIAAHPHSSMKTILMDAVEKCRKAQRTLANYRRRERSDLSDKMNQMASALQELDSQSQDLQAETQLL